MPLAPLTRRAVPVAALGLALAALVAPTAASADTARADYEMNEPKGASTMVDSSGHQLDGHIGDSVEVQGTAYHFPYIKNNYAGGPVDPQHLVVVPSSDLLNPGTDPYSVSLRTWFTGNANGRNIVQKGQSGTPGGYWKIEIHKSRFSCLFRGAAGEVSVSLPAVYKQWHDVTCSRTDAGVSLTVDGKTVTHAGPTGSIANTLPFVIGGKYSCASTSVQCDYFAGLVDRVVVS